MEKIPKEERTVYYDLKKFEWKYRNLIFLFMSVVIAYYILTHPLIHQVIERSGEYGYFGAFIAGLCFTYGLTTVPATATLFILSEELNSFLIASIAAAGAVISDYLIFRFVKDKLLKEIKIVSTELGIKVDIKLKQSKLLHKIVPIIAGLIIASPLPDELAAALFGAVKMETKKFILYSYIFNFIGILIVSLAAKII